MQINSDLSQRAIEQSESLAWVPSPMKGVSRRMLERDGEEVARATSLVKYEPGSYFSAHTHTGGEEFLVLDGVFSDEMGNFPKGSYVRNPVGSSHKPHSENGCIILVKLWQMPADDQKFVRLNIYETGNWTQKTSKEAQLLLHETEHELVQARRWSPGFSAERIVHYPKGAEIFIIEGDFKDENRTYPKGTWLRLAPDSQHRPSSRSGCLLYIKSGHLTANLPRPDDSTIKGFS